MARIFIDGFETGGFEMWDFDTPASDVTSVVGVGAGALTGKYSCQLQGTLSSTFILKKVFTPTYDVFFGANIRANSYPCAFRIYFSTESDDESVSSPDFLIYFEFTFSENKISISVYTNDGYQDIVDYYILGSTTQFNVQIEVKSVSKNAYIYMNGFLALSVTPYSGGAGPISNVAFYMAGGDGDRIFIDDVALDDEELPGISKIYSIIPWQNGETNQWNKTDTTSFESVNNIPIDTDKYISSKTFNEIDLFETTNLEVTPTLIKSVQIQATSMQVAGPPPNQYLRMISRMDSTNFFGELDTPHNASRYTGAISIFEKSPNSRENWTKGEIDNMQIGVKLIAG